MTIISKMKTTYTTKGICYLGLGIKSVECNSKMLPVMKKFRVSGCIQSQRNFPHGYQTTKNIKITPVLTTRPT